MSTVSFLFFFLGWILFFSSDLISTSIHLCSRSARAGRWCWSATTVARAPRKEPSLITAGWETAEEAWWVLPGKPYIQTHDKMKRLGPRVLLHLRYRLHFCFLPAVILPLGWTGLYRSPAAPWSAITTQAGLSLTKERRGSSNSNQTLRTLLGLFIIIIILIFLENLLLFRWRVWSHKVHKTILFCIVLCSLQRMVSPTVVLLP